MVSTKIACPGASTFYGLPDSYVCERNVFNLISIINMNNYFRPDVWFVTHTQGITNTTTKHGSLITVFFILSALFWITEPKTIKEMSSVYQPWECKERVVPPQPCNLPSSCPLSFKGANVTETRYKIVSVLRISGIKKS
jgi:hypothetical protein